MKRASCAHPHFLSIIQIAGDQRVWISAGCHPAQHQGLLDAQLQLRLLELLLDGETVGHKAPVVLWAVPGMVPAEGDKLLADSTPSAVLPFAALGVLDDSFHLLAGGQCAVGIAALAGMEQGLDVALDAQAARFCWVLQGSTLFLAGLIIQAKSQFFHRVVMAFRGIAGDTQDILLANCAAPVCVHLFLALSAGVDEPIDGVTGLVRVKGTPGVCLF